ANEWATFARTARYSGNEQALYAAFNENELAGIGGLTIDPQDPTALRLRRFYVRPAHRRGGTGRQLAEALTAGLKRRLVVNAGNDEAARFWEALGFIPDRRDGHTHRKVATSDWTPHYLEAPGSLEKWRPLIDAEIEATHRIIAPLVPPPRLDILVQRSSFV